MAAASLGAPKKRPCRRPDAIGAKLLWDRRPLTLADDLEKPKPVDGGPLERLRKYRVDGRRSGLPRTPVGKGGKIHADRSAEAEPADRPGVRPVRR